MQKTLIQKYEIWNHDGIFCDIELLKAKILVKEFSLVILKEFKEEDAFLEQFAEDNHLLDVQQTFEN